jgi:ferredoxin--NADP+ reductase
VALDMARVLAKSRDELAKYDVSDRALAWLSAIDLAEIHIVGRRSAAQTRFSPAELSELERLSRFQPCVSNTDVASAAGEPENAAAFAVLKEFSSGELAAGRKPINFHFNNEPVRYCDGLLEFSDPNGNVSILADLVIFAIGQQPSNLDNMSRSSAADSAQDQADITLDSVNTFLVGWAAGSDQGDIAKARASGTSLASKIVLLINSKRHISSADFLDLCRKKQLNPMSWEEWQRIDKYEIAIGAAQCKRRRKIVAKRKSDLLRELAQNHS